MKADFRICLSSPPDRERLVAEMFYKDYQWAELNQETETLLLKLYPRQDGEPWKFEFEEALEALTMAGDRLLNRK
jgi:hypothetical protein